MMACRAHVWLTEDGGRRCFRCQFYERSKSFDELFAEWEPKVGTAADTLTAEMMVNAFPDHPFLRSEMYKIVAGWANDEGKAELAAIRAVDPLIAEIDR